MSLLLIVAVLAVGSVVMAFMADLAPDVTPDFNCSFDTGTAPFTYDTKQGNLVNIVVTMYNFSASAWDTINATNVTYVGTTVTVDTWAVNTTNHNTTTHINAQYSIDTSVWAKLIAIIIFVVVVSVIFLIFKAFPKTKE